LLEIIFLAEEERVRVEFYEKELKIGQVVQRGLLPSKMPTLEGIEIAERYLPAKEVGGDFYDVFLRTCEGKEQIALVVADASGKGVQACFYSLGVRSDLRVFAREYQKAGQVMKNVNRLFYSDSGDTGMFVTLLLGIYDPKTNELEYSSCGHNPPYLRKSDGTIEMLGGVDMALGVKKELDPQTRKVRLQKGDLLVFYTDGVTETHNENNELFSEARLEQFIKEKGNLSAERVAGELIKELKEFQGKALQHDDITLLLMKLL
jgi:sigma-B regulation protein RsbU (phosphoserine phosphatase)